MMQPDDVVDVTGELDVILYIFYIHLNHVSLISLSTY
jgi:hypothetical protein